MAEKVGTVFARMDLGVKEKAESIFKDLGISSSAAITMFYKQVINYDGIPFPVTNSKRERPLDPSKLTREELLEEIQKGYDDVIAGRISTLEDFEKEIKKEFKKEHNID